MILTMSVAHARDSRCLAAPHDDEQVHGGLVETPAFRALAEDPLVEALAGEDAQRVLHDALAAMKAAREGESGRTFAAIAPLRAALDELAAAAADPPPAVRRRTRIGNGPLPIAAEARRVAEFLARHAQCNDEVGFDLFG